MSWLNCCPARGYAVFGGESERDWLMAPEGEVPQAQRELICSDLESALRQLISASAPPYLCSDLSWFLAI